MSFDEMTEKETNELDVRGMTKEEELQVEHDKLDAKQALKEAMDEKKRKEPTIKIGRNEKCPCQSGKKFKKCCEGKINRRQPVRVMEAAKRGQVKKV